MKIGFLADIYTPHVSGVTQYIRSTQSVLKEMGHEPFVFTFGGRSVQPEEQNVYRTPGIPFGTTGFNFNPSFSRTAINGLREMDILHLNHPFVSARIALRTARPLGIPVLFTSHTRYDLYMNSYLPWIPTNIAIPILRAYLASLTKEIDLVVSPSRGMARILRDLGIKAPIQIIPNGIDLSIFQNPGKAIHREELGYSHSDIILVYFGRLAPEKNLEVLIGAFSALAKNDHHLRLIMIGSGPSKKDLEAQSRKMGISGQVKFLGSIQHEYLPGYLVMCDAFVTPSISEVHPLSVIEAMAIGMPVVGIKSPGVEDLVLNGVTGFLSNKGGDDFTHCIRDLITNPEMRCTMGIAAKDASNQYDIKNTVSALVTIYDQLIERAASRKTPSVVHDHLSKGR